MPELAREIPNGSVSATGAPPRLILCNERLPKSRSINGQRLDQMARDLVTTFRNRKIELYPDDNLLNDLYRLSIVERRYGYKLETVSDERGHANTATALAIAFAACS